MTAEQVDAAARALLTDAGLGERFLHRTGHGIGLDVHEDPYIVGGNELPLEPGMAFSVEPGVYLDGEWGARIEDIVVVTEDGCERLNTRPRELVVLYPLPGRRPRPAPRRERTCGDRKTGSDPRHKFVVDGPPLARARCDASAVRRRVTGGAAAACRCPSRRPGRPPRRRSGRTRRGSGPLGVPAAVGVERLLRQVQAERVQPAVHSASGRP